MNKVISKYENRLSILLIKDTIRNPASFSFKKASLSAIEKDLNTKKVNTFGSTPPKNMRASKESRCETLAELFNIPY